MAKSSIAALMMAAGLAFQTTPTEWIKANAIPLTTTEPGRCVERGEIQSKPGATCGRSLRTDGRAHEDDDKQD